MSLAARGLALAVALALLVAGCGGSDEKPKASAKGSAAAEPTTEPGSDEPAADPGYQAPEVGQCYHLTPAQSRASVVSRAKVKCSSKHTTVVSYVGYVKKPVTPRTPLAKRQALGKRLCEPAYRRYAGGTLADRATSILTWTLFTPGQSQLKRGARWVRCDVLARSGGQLIPLPEGDSPLENGVPDQLRVCQNVAGIDVSCSQPHAFRVEAVYQAAGKAYPAAPAYTRVARTRCKELMNKFGGYWQPPSRSGWKSGDHFIRCLSAKTPTPAG
jgi:Septum formation